MVDDFDVELVQAVAGLNERNSIRPAAEGQATAGVVRRIMDLHRRFVSAM